MYTALYMHAIIANTHLKNMHFVIPLNIFLTLVKSKAQSGSLS